MFDGGGGALAQALVQREAAAQLLLGRWRRDLHEAAAPLVRLALAPDDLAGRRARKALLHLANLVVAENLPRKLVGAVHDLLPLARVDEHRVVQVEEDAGAERLLRCAPWRVHQQQLVAAALDALVRALLESPS